ncbi:MAG: hypothetical protein KUG82_01780 [Pseudomonadales bacterium]|nr:hypothetical protein [Pseudomonadales bacterium]
MDIKLKLKVKLMLNALFLVIGSALIVGCMSAPQEKSNRSRIELSTEDLRNDMTAKVSEIKKISGEVIVITPENYNRNYIDVWSDRYQVVVKCYKESDGGIYFSGSTMGTFKLNAGELLRLEFRRDQELVTNDKCPLLFSTKR